MSWRWFLPLLLAALVLGHPVRAPKLAESLPERRYRHCDYSGALHVYLLAYAYAHESPGISRRLLDTAERELARCEGEHALLTARISQLRTSLP